MYSQHAQTLTHPSAAQPPARPFPRGRSPPEPAPVAGPRAATPHPRPAEARPVHRLPRSVVTPWNPELTGPTPRLSLLRGNDLRSLRWREGVRYRGSGAPALTHGRVRTMVRTRDFPLRRRITTVWADRRITTDEGCRRPAPVPAGGRVRSSVISPTAILPSSTASQRRGSCWATLNARGIVTEDSARVPAHFSTRS